MGFAALMTVLLASATTAAPGAQKFWYTYPMPPHEHPADPMHVNPAFQVVENPERYTWKITGKIQGKQVYAQSVPVYSFGEDGYDRPTRVGEIPVGTEVKLDAFRRVGNLIFYAVPYPASKLPVYVSGQVIEPVAYTPPVQ